MSSFWRINSNRKSKKDKDYGLVKGGLTPTLPRKRSPVEVTPAEEGDNVRKNQNHRYSVGGSTSRPLMTHPVPQPKLPRWEITPGLLGVYNHGNTCFMNTVIQCLSNTDLFSDYFLRKKFKELLSVKGIAKRIVGNPRGEVTECLGNLLETIWSGEYTPDVSSQFKNVVSKYNTQYKGSSQHDAQEFLLWLLDRVNEELHQSQKKKNKDSSSSKTKKDKQMEVAEESSPEMVLAASCGFEVYNKFQALYQSSLTCPNCGEHSNTYETYLCLSLPVPQKCLRPVYLTVVYLDENPKQLKIALKMNALDTVKNLREKLAFELDVPPKRLVLCQVYEDGFRNTYGDGQPLSDIHESENVYVFETHPFSDVSKAQSSYEHELVQILLLHTEKISSTKCYRFCSPQIIRIPRDINYSTLQKYILRSMGLAVSEDVVEKSVTFDPKCPMFDIRVIDSGVSECYLATEVEMPLYTEPIDRAISTYTEEFGPPHVKFVIEWDPRMKDSVVLNDDDMLDEHESVHQVRLSQQQPTHVSLDECLRLFTKEEKLSDGDAWNCPGCLKSQQGTIKKLGLWSTPDILVIHLKRFRQVGSKRNKLNILVNFPKTDLEMGSYILPSTDDKRFSDLYDLYAVSNHYGNMNGGHYTAFCKNPVDNRWYEYDDTHVKPLDQREIVSRAAYLLFYQRKKLVNTTLDTLQSGSHWVYSVYGPPKELSYSNSPELENRKQVDSEKMDRDYHEMKAESPRGYTFTRHKSDLSEHKADEFYESLRVDLNSPRREEKDLSAEINSPRQSSRSSYGGTGSPRKQLFDSAAHKSASSDTSKRVFEKTRATVAEQIIQSKANVEQDQTNSYRLEPQFTEHGGDLRVNLHHSNSVDSGRHSFSHTSSSGTSHGSAPPSPQYEAANNNKHMTQNVSSSNSDSRPLQSNVLNNTRDVHGSVINTSVSSVKLKVHSNQIHSDENGFKDGKKETDDMFVSKVQNQNVSNLSGVSKANLQSNVSPTPQQRSRSPPPPVLPERGFWFTPQPQRKQYNNSDATSSRPAMNRQLSYPTRSNRPVSEYDMKALIIEGSRVPVEQSRSLPTETATTADKPPLPKPGHSSNRSNQSRMNGYDHSRQLPPRPATSHANNRVSSSSDHRPLNAKEPAHSVENQLYEIEVQRTARLHSEMKERSRSTDRHNENYGRESRIRAEHPVSYHHTHNDEPADQYYLSQPIDPPSFGRTNKYATMRPVRMDMNLGPYLENEIHHLPRQNPYSQLAQEVTQMHQPRSRAPLSYNPHKYQDGRLDFPRYQPQMHQAKFFSKLAIHDREVSRKMKSQYLKESSV